jgi:hypothetical protein
MTRDEWRQVLATEPATPEQLGAVMGEFRRIGLDHSAERAERLVICAALLGLDDLASTRDLVMGQAGQLVRALRQVADRAELEAAAGLTGIERPGERVEAAPRPSPWVPGIRQEVARIIAAWPAEWWKVPGMP